MKINFKGIRIFQFIGVIACGVATSACGTRLAVSDQEKLAAQTLNPPKGKGLLCVYRPPNVRAVLAARPIFVNDQHLASTQNGSFVMIPLTPRNYRVQGSALGLLPELTAPYPEIHLTVQSGKTYFIKQSVEGSIFGEGATSVSSIPLGNGSSAPLVMEGGMPPFVSKLVNASVAKQECKTLTLVGAKPYKE